MELGQNGLTEGEKTCLKAHCVNPYLVGNSLNSNTSQYIWTVVKEDRKQKELWKAESEEQLREFQMACYTALCVRNATVEASVALVGSGVDLIRTNCIGSTWTKAGSSKRETEKLETSEAKANLKQVKQGS